VRGLEEHTGRDTLDTTTTGETTDGGLGDALDVVTEDLAVTLGAAFAEAFATFTACGNVSNIFVDRGRDDDWSGCRDWGAYEEREMVWERGNGWSIEGQGGCAAKWWRRQQL